MWHYRILKIAIFVLLLGSLISCSGNRPPTANGTWALVKLISIGQPIQSTVRETIEVRNCVVPEVKSTSCSAGTSNSLSISFGGSIELGEGFSGSIDSSISSSLGIGQESGQSISLDSPSSGYIFTYEIDKRFTIINGEVLARSSNGNEQVATYVFSASCSITIVARELNNCTDIGQNPGGSHPVQTSAITVTVYANEAWQDTGISVNAGDVLTIRYTSGEWGWTGDRSGYDGNGDPDLNGTYLEICPTKYDCPITDAQLQALVGRIGINGSSFLIGNSLTFTVPSGSGNNQKLFLMGNDSLSGLHDNVGSIEVSIEK